MALPPSPHLSPMTPPSPPACNNLLPQLLLTLTYTPHPPITLIIIIIIKPITLVKTQPVVMVDK